MPARRFPSGDSGSRRTRWLIAVMDRATSFVPRLSVAAQCARRGREDVVRGCIELLAGNYDDVALIAALGGPPADWMIAGNSRADVTSWYRVWAARGLLWAWDDVATTTIEAALTDPAWRVREMACKVVARHGVDVEEAELLTLRADPVERVRRNAQRALERLTQAGL